MKLSVHTLRIGHVWWMKACAPSLGAWCDRHGHTLTVWRGRDIPRGYPHPKFCQIDMLRRFLASDATHFFYIDADVYVDGEAPAHPALPGPGLLAMPDVPTRISRTWPRWAKVRFPQARRATTAWTYRNAGIWFCDRAAAELILQHAVPPFHRGCMDQNNWNVWLALAHHDGMPVHDLPVIWNAYNYWKDRAHFYHLAGRNKPKKYADRVERGHIPAGLLEESEITDTPPLHPIQRKDPMKPFSLADYAYTADTKGWTMDDLHIHLLRQACELDTGIPPMDRQVVEIGAFQGRSTAALVHALECGVIGHLHIVEVKPPPPLFRLISESPAAGRITLHTRPFWELDLPINHLAFIDGDHRWPALADTLACLSMEIPVIAMHDSHSHTIPIPGTWGAHTAANILRKHKTRHTWEDHAARPGLRTDRGFFISATFPVTLPNP